MLNRDVHNLIIQVLPDILSQYQLVPFGAHGVTHWARVLENGLRMAEHTGADPSVLAYFAVFHDACRRNESHDPGHGRRGAELAQQLRASVQLNPRAFQHLLTACRMHTDGWLEADPTVQTCWDSDRLDLPRVGIIVSPHRLCTKAARAEETVTWASERARHRYEPGFVREVWIAAGGGMQTS